MRGSGRGGRIRERDVRLGGVGVEMEGRIVSTTNTRQIIAARMVAGVTQAAPVTLTTKADVTDLVALRESMGTDAPSYTAYLIRAVALALKDHPMLRAQWRDEGLFIPESLHIAFAVDTDAGLLAPVLRNADRLSVDEIALACRALTIQARAGTLRAENMHGAVFTLSNLGMFGVDSFTPIIHLPQCAVLGVGRIVREAVIVDDDIEARDRMTLCLTFDHRITDGAPAARFLDAVRQGIEHPALPGE
jgi:pyruvate dehydrogenase E2 component (dihydrolipoamide acetyltransferase)